MKTTQALKKILPILCMVSVCITSQAQFAKFEGIWISSALDYLKIKDSGNTDPLYYANTLGNVNMKVAAEVYIHADTIIFSQKYNPSQKFGLLVTSKNDTGLTIRPITKLAKDFFQNRASIRFIKQGYNVDHSIQFEKLVYTTTSCRGDCPEFYMEIDNRKNVYLDGLFFVYEKIIPDTIHGLTKAHPDLLLDTARSGYFVGVLDDTLYNQLILLLKTSHLKTVKVPRSMVSDGPNETLTIFFSGQQKYFATHDFPTVLSSLVGYLYSLNTKVNWVRTEKKRK
jgi:hypothetical protein